MVDVLVSGKDRGIYRDELAAAQARIADLEAQIAARDEQDAASPRFARLHAERAQLISQGRRFLGLGPNGLAAVVVMALVVGSVMVMSAPAGRGLLAVALVVLTLLLTMMALVLRIGRHADTKHRVARVDEKIDDLARDIAIARDARSRVRVSPDQLDHDADADEDAQELPARRMRTP